MELGGAAEVLGRGEASEFAEVVDEVCLVGIAEVEGELRAVEGLAVVEAFEQLVKTKAADDPFGRCSNVGIEESLQGADAQAGAGGEGVYAEDGRLVEDGVNEPGGECGVGVSWG